MTAPQREPEGREQLEVERRLLAQHAAYRDDGTKDPIGQMLLIPASDVAHMLVAAAQCDWMGHGPDHAEDCPVCSGTKVDPSRLEAGFRAMEGGA